MSFNRRSFLKGFAASTALVSGGCGSFAVGRSPKFVGPGQKVRLGIVGTGGKGMYDWTHLYAAGAEIVAFCDVDSKMIDEALAKFQELGGNVSKVRRYSDWRKMLECEERSIDCS